VILLPIFIPSYTIIVCFSIFLQHWWW